MGKEVLVVPREILFMTSMFQGVRSTSEGQDFYGLVLNKHSYSQRTPELEKDSSLKQIIPYIWIVNDSGKVFLYRRGANKTKQESSEVGEKRYLGKYSGGVGGHIDRITDEGSRDPIFSAMMRELREEVHIGDIELSNYPKPEIIGYINDDSDDIGKVHFGVLGLLRVSGDVKGRQNEGLLDGRFYSIDEVESL